MEATRFVEYLKRSLLEDHSPSDAGAGFEPELSYGRHRGPARVGVREAAVVALCYYREGQWYLPLILRPHHLSDHAGQISLPGGGVDPGETGQEGAARELEEELGVPRQSIQMVGQLSPVFVYASNFYVEPYVATMRERPDFRPNRSEVERLLEIPLAHLLNRRNDSQLTISRRGLCFQAPSILYAGYHVWGATAVILNELIAICSKFDFETS